MAKLNIKVWNVAVYKFQINSSVKWLIHRLYTTWTAVETIIGVSYNVVTYRVKVQIAEPHLAFLSGKLCVFWFFKIHFKEHFVGFRQLLMLR